MRLLLPITFAHRLHGAPSSLLNMQTITRASSRTASRSLLSVLSRQNTQPRLLSHRRNMSNGSVINIGSESAYDTLLGRAKSANLPVVVDFTASWCGPCKAIAPVYEGLAKENPKTVFLKVDIDEQKELAQRYKVASVPTFISFTKSGEQLPEVKGANPQGLKDLVKSATA